MVHGQIINAMRRRGAATLIFCAAAAAFLSGAAGAANSQTYADAVGDAGGGPDITAVTIANDDAGNVRVDTAIAGGMPSNAYLHVYFDTPPAETNLWNFRLRFDGPANGCFSETFSGTWVAFTLQGFACEYLPGAGFRFTFNSSSYGSPASVGFIVQTYHTNGVTLADALVEREYAIDTADPQTTITSGPQATTTSTTASFTYTSSEASSTFECSLDNGAFTACPTIGANYGALGVGAAQLPCARAGCRGQPGRDAGEPLVDRPDAAPDGPHVQGEELVDLAEASGGREARGRRRQICL